MNCIYSFKTSQIRSIADRTPSISELQRAGKAACSKSISARVTQSAYCFFSRELRLLHHRRVFPPRALLSRPNALQIWTGGPTAGGWCSIRASLLSRRA